MPDKIDCAEDNEREEAEKILRQNDTLHILGDGTLGYLIAVNAIRAALKSQGIDTKSIGEREAFELDWMRRYKTNRPPERNGDTYIYDLPESEWIVWQACLAMVRQGDKS